jgi:signal transduction histidine kinase
MDLEREILQGRVDLVLRVLRGDLTIEEAAAHAGVTAAEVERWRASFVSAGRCALDGASCAGPDTFRPCDASPREWVTMLPEQVRGTSWIVDPALRFLAACGLEHFLGRPSASLIGTTLYELLDTDDATTPPIAGHLRALSGAGGSYETVWVGRVFQYRLHPLRDGAGGVVGVFGTSLDVTEWQRSATALREQNERFHFLLEQVPAILWTTDRELRITSSIGAGLKAIGRVENDLVGVTLSADPDATHAGPAPFAGQLAALRGESGFVEGVWAGRDYGTYYRPLRGDAGDVTGVVGLTIDLSERKQVERAREELLQREQLAREQAEVANRMKDEFVATVSHELRTPLNAILGWARLLREDTLEPETHARALETIERNAAAQARLVEDLLDVSSIVSGRARLDVRPVRDLAALASAAIDSMRPAASAKGVELRERFADDPGVVLGDPERLQQIVWNLVSNAVKFTPRAGRVEIALERSADHVELRVHDTGEGIAPAFLPHVFDRFRQQDASPSRRHGGAGLGLAIVRHLVELQGGEVRAESAGPGLGATFTARFPLLSTEAAVHAQSRAGEEARGARSALAGLRVVAVDDEPDTLEVIRITLERASAQVRTASNALEALEQVVRWHPDVLLADIGMPQHDGYWLLQRVRDLAPARGGSVPAVALTAYARSEDRRRALAAGFQLYLAKPVEPSALVAALARLRRG